MRLILMRHTKSDWSTAVDGDHGRPLNARGQRAAVALGNWLRDANLTPDLALCSTAQRTRDTLAGLALTVPTRFDDRLYLGDPDQLLKVLQEAEGTTVLLVAHNPGIADLAQHLVATPPAHDRFRDYPTGATLVADFAAPDWAAIEPGTATASAFTVPRDLE